MHHFTVVHEVSNPHVTVPYGFAFVVISRSVIFVLVYYFVLVFVFVLPIIFSF